MCVYYKVFRVCVDEILELYECFFVRHLEFLNFQLE